MPPKGGKKPGGSGAGNNANEERVQPLQAVVFADSFETRFNPFTLQHPRCLLPLVNVPLIEYTLEFLASNAAGSNISVTGGTGSATPPVEQVFLYCGNGADEVEDYLSKSKWLSDVAPFSLEIVKSSARSIGDAMRDLDAKGLIVGDFICVYGDVVANLSLAPALAAHKARREKDKKAAMTMVLRDAGDYRRLATQSLRSIFVVDPQTQRCLHYEQLRPGQNAAIDIAGDILREHAELEIREDLLDCGIDICSPEVLLQYTDNFDWQLPRRGFLHGVLKDFELNQMTIHTHIASEGYAARVKNLQAYDTISKDVVARWAYPLCPDSNLVPDQSFRLLKGNIYQEDGVVLARSSTINRKCVLGKGTIVGEGTTISNTVIGRRCTIGNRVKITGAYIWDDVHISDDTVIDSAVIASWASIGSSCKIDQGALLSFKVKIANGTKVIADRRITTLKRKRGYEQDEILPASTDPKIVGEGGVGAHLELDEDEEEPADVLLRGIQGLDLTVEEDAISTLDSDDELDVDYDDAQRGSFRAGSFASVASDESGGEARVRAAAAADFHNEAVVSLFDALQKEDDPDTMQLELRGLTLSSNAEGKQVRKALAVAYCKRIVALIENNSASPKEAVERVIPSNKLLIRNNVREEDEQVEFLLYLQTELARHSQGEKILLFAANALATNDLVEAEGFETWWNDPRSSASEELDAVRKDTKQLVDVLVDDEDEDDEEDDEDDEDEDSDE